MNIFMIPSWYPSKGNPIYGIFNKEQAYMLAKHRPSFSVGVSKWGQGDERLLIPALSFRSYPKLLNTYDEENHQLSSNLTEYFTPAFTWTRKFRQGNIQGIIEANKQNLERYIVQYGTPDVLLAHATYPAAIVAQNLSEELGIPYLVTIYMSPFPFDEFVDKRGELKKIIERPLKRANRILSSCSELKDTLKAFGLDSITTIPLPVDTDFFTPDNSIKSEYIRILSVGRIEEQKGFDLLLRAIATIDKPIELRIGGDGSLLSKYKALAEELNISDKVEWLGLLDKEQVRAEMRSCSFYVLSSRHETFGIVQVEAMACGKPVVATRSGGPQDIITKQNGILCDITVDGISESIEQMINTYQIYEPESIRREAVSKFGHEKWVEQMEALFKEVV